MNSYNENPSWLKSAILSYKTQQDVNVELILSMVKGDSNISLAEKIGGCKVILNDKPGIYSQLNEAVKHMTGDFVCYASSNDTAPPTKLVTEYSLLKKTGRAVCYSAFNVTDQNGRITGIRQFPKTYDINEHLKGNFISDCALVRSDIFSKYIPFDEQWGNHAYYDLWLRIYAGEGNVFVYNPTPTWNYRKHKGMRRDRNKDQQKVLHNQQLRVRLQQHHKSSLFDKKLDNSVPKIVDIWDKSECEICPLYTTNKPDMNEISDNNKDTVSFVCHIVYVYVKSPAKWMEMQTSVKSVRTHFKSPHKIFVVGDNPGIPGVIHLPIMQIRGANSKPKDALKKLLFISLNPQINEKFLYFYDDIVLLRDVTWEWFEQKIIANDHVKDPATYFSKPTRGVSPVGAWRHMFDRTFAFLQKKGLPTYNYETHLPRIFEKSKIQETYRRFGALTENGLFSSLYFNLHYTQPNILLNANPMIKAGIHRPYDKPERLEADVKGRIFLNYNDVGLNDLLKKYITNHLK